MSIFIVAGDRSYNFLGIVPKTSIFDGYPSIRKEVQTSYSLKACPLNIGRGNIGVESSAIVDSLAMSRSILPAKSSTMSGAVTC